METDFSPEAIAGRERKRASTDGRRMIATAIAIAVFAIAVFALGGAMLNAFFSEGKAPAETPKALSPDQRVERLRFAAGQAWRAASERDRVLVLLEWQTEMDDLRRSRGEFNDAVAERQAALTGFVGTCLDSTVARGGLALQATVSEIAEGCLEVALARLIHEGDGGRRDICLYFGGRGFAGRIFQRMRRRHCASPSGLGLGLAILAPVMRARA